MGDKKITRSTGIPITVGRVCYGFAGGGYTGKTTELDEMLQQEAEILRGWLDKEIEIRFNSDRRSGGAWVKDNFGSCQIGLNAGLKGDIEGLRVDTYISVAVMKDGALAKVDVGSIYKGRDGQPDTLSMNHPDLATAVTWLKDNIDPKKIRVRKK